MFSPSSSATRARLRKEILLVLSSSKSLNTFSMSSRGSFSPILPVIIWRNSPNSMVPLPSPSMSHHLLELLVLDLEAKGTHGGLELTDVDHAGGISIEEGERLADLVELLLSELTWLLLGSTA